MRGSLDPAATSLRGVLTPLGLLPAAGLTALRAFGEQAERLEYPYIDVGGFIVPGRDPAETNLPGMEHECHAASAREGAARWGQPPRDQARPAAGARQRPSAPQAAPGASPHTVERRLTTLNLDLPGLVEYHPLTRVVASSGRVVYLNIPLGVLHEVPIGARLTLEVPVLVREQLSRSMQLSGVPDVRAWAVWERGPMHGSLIVSHHQNPDRAICASMPGQWIMGVHPLRDYVAFCAVWVAKALHELLIGFYPGPQHCTVMQRVARNRPDEYCGCGKRLRYRDCCRSADLARSPYDRWREVQLAQTHYFRELARQERAQEPPEKLLRLGLSPR